MPEVVEVHGAELFPNLFDGVRMQKITLNMTAAIWFFYGLHLLESIAMLSL